MDLEKFFDRVNHDILMSRVAKEIVDVRVLRLVRRYLQAGMMANGIDEVRKEGRNATRWPHITTALKHTADRFGS